MNIAFVASAAALLALSALPARATDVGVSVQISQPGVYGRIDIGRFPQPQVVVAQPVVMVQPRYVAVAPQPVMTTSTSLAMSSRTILIWLSSCFLRTVLQPMTAATPRRRPEMMPSFSGRKEER